MGTLVMKYVEGRRVSELQIDTKDEDVRSLIAKFHEWLRFNGLEANKENFVTWSDEEGSRYVGCIE
jgi:hypothetical protein